MNKDSEWYKFQERICTHFKSIGARAQTNVTVQGIRTTHDIDILVETKFLGQDLTWIVEAKNWKSKVNKLHVLGLRAIVEDIGADRGFIVSQKGFQSGAIEAANKSNIRLISFDELVAQTNELIQTEIIKTYEKRLNLIEHRYWSHNKRNRIKYGLRGDIWDYPLNFSGNILLMTARRAINDARKNEYPIDLETYMKERQGLLIANNFQELINWLNLNLNYIDEKILLAEISMSKNGDFNPDLYLREDNELPINMMINFKRLLND